MTKKERKEKSLRKRFLGYKSLGGDITQEEREEAKKLSEELDAERAARFGYRK